MQIAVVVNPTSGKGKGEHIAREAARVLRGHGHGVEEIRGEDAPNAHARLKVHVAARKPDVVAVVGGDGALHELLPTLHELRVTTAMIPAGTGPLPLTAEIVPRGLTVVVA